MRVRDLIKETTQLSESTPTQKDKLYDEIEKLKDVIEKFENGGELSKDDLEKTDMLKDFIKSMIKDNEQKKIIKGDK